MMSAAEGKRQRRVLMREVEAEHRRKLRARRERVGARAVRKRRYTAAELASVPF